MERKVKKDNEIWRKVTELEELFFYALYKFKAFWGVGKISLTASNKIKKVLNINVANYNIELTTNNLIHFYNSHFNEKRINQRDIKFSDIKELPNIINKFSSVGFGNKQDTLIFTRKNPDCILELVVTIDHERKILSGKSLRVKT